MNINVSKENIESNNILSLSKEYQSELIQEKVEAGRVNIINSEIQRYGEDKEYIESLKKRYFFYAWVYNGRAMIWVAKNENKPVYSYYYENWEGFLWVSRVKDNKTEHIDYRQALELLWITELSNWNFVIEKEKKVIEKEDKEYFEIIIEIEKLNTVSAIDNYINLDEYNIPFTDEELKDVGTVSNNENFLKFLEQKWSYYRKRFDENPAVILKMMKGWKNQIINEYPKLTRISLWVDKYKVMTFSKFAVDVDRWYIPDEKILKEITDKINNYYVDLSKKEFARYGYIVDMKDIELARKRGWIR